MFCLSFLEFVSYIKVVKVWGLPLEKRFRVKRLKVSKIPGAPDVKVHPLESFDVTDPAKQIPASRKEKVLEHNQGSLPLAEFKGTDPQEPMGAELHEHHASACQAASSLGVERNTAKISSSVF